MQASEKMKAANQVAALGVGTNVLLTIFKFYAGFVAGSSAMISDAAHSASDIGATMTVYLGLRLANRPPDETHHYGHGRMESVAAKIVALILLVTGIGLGWEALQLLLAGELEAPGAIALWAAVISIVTKEGLFRFVNRVGERLRSTAIKAEALHHRSDTFSSIAALLGIGGARLGFPILDPLASLAVAFLIARMGFSIYWRSIEELVDRAPDPETLEAISHAVAATQGVIDVNEVKARLHASKILADVRLCVDRDITVGEGHDIAARAKQNIKQQVDDVQDVLIHVNPCPRDVGGANKPDCDDCHQERRVGKSRRLYTRMG